MKVTKSVVQIARSELDTYLAAKRAQRHPNAIFIWIPKTAGTSVYEMLTQADFVKLKTVGAVRRMFDSRGRVTFGHMSIPSLVEAGHVMPEFVHTAFKFAVVRNPYQRAVSLYNYLRRLRKFQHWHRDPTFSDFLRIIESGFVERVGMYNVLGLSQCNPQCDWLRGLAVDRVFRVESLAAELDELRRVFDAPDLRMGHANRSTGVDSTDLTAEQRQLIERIYHEDFARFGYPTAG